MSRRGGIVWPRNFQAKWPGADLFARHYRLSIQDQFNAEVAKRGRVAGRDGQQFPDYNQGGGGNTLFGSTFATSASLLSLALNYRFLPIYER